MKKKIYFVRHGQSLWNVDALVCGRTDIGLSEKGISQAKELAERIKKENVHIDEVVASPLIRAKMTGQFIADAAGVPLRVDERLIENDYGRFEKTNKDLPEFQNSKRDFADDFGGTESQLRIAQRIFNLLDELKNDDKVYLLAAHNGVSRCVNAYFNSLTNEEFASFWVDNCSLTEFEYKE